MAAEIFLSYSRDDQPVAHRFAESLQREGFTVWWDQTLRSGEAYDEVTEQALRSARAVVVLWSTRSVASRWVRAEATIADRAGTLMPVMIEPCDRPVMFELRQSADLSGWQGAADDRRWRAFVEDLRLRTGSQPPRSSSVTAQHAVPTAPQRVLQRKPLIAGIAVLALALVGIGAWALLRPPGNPQTSVRQRTGDAKLAVLPFIDISPAGDQEYFADGMTEEILNSLARLKGLQVSGRTSSFYFKGKNEDMKVIGEKLGVEFLLEGSVRRAGEELRITAQLVKAVDGFHLWSQTYDRSVKDVFAVQEDIARSVADALQIALGVGDLASLPGMTRNVDAYEAWMASQAAAGRGNTRDNVASRMQNLELAVARDPQFFLAWVDLAGIYRGQAGLFPDNPDLVRVLRAKTQDALDKARKIVPDPLFEPLLDVSPALGRGDWVKYGRLLPTLIAVTDKYRRVPLSGPAGPDQFLLTVDRAGLAIDGLEKLRARDPLNTTQVIFLAEAYGNSGRLTDALAEQDRGLKMSRDEVLAANALMVSKATGNPQLIEQRWEQLRALVPNPQDLALAMYALRNRPAEARAELRRLAAIQPRTVTTSRLTLWAAFFEDYELALQVLREDKDTDRRNITALALWRPVMAGTRALPGFKDFVREWGFVDYWREFGWGDHCKPVGDTDFQCN